MISSEELAMISGLANIQVQIEKEIVKLNEDLKIKMEELKVVQEITLPNAMAEVGMSEFKLSDGTKISIKNDVFASIPKDDGGRAFNWLRGHDFGGLIKNVVSCEFGKGEDAKAIEAAQLLAQSGYHPTQKESVHPSTLKAFVKEMMGNGQDVPADVFGVFTTTKSKVELPK
jgi:hypothetical protein